MTSSQFEAYASYGKWNPIGKWNFDQLPNFLEDEDEPEYTDDDPGSNDVHKDDPLDEVDKTLETPMSMLDTSMMILETPMKMMDVPMMMLETSMTAIQIPMMLLNMIQ